MNTQDSSYRMKKAFVLFIFLMSSASYGNEPCQAWNKWTKPACKRLHQLWTEGSNEIYFTGYAWHNREKYSRERVNTYNELAWGGGLGKGLYDEDGDWHGLFAFAFLDSHKNVEPAAGYSFLKTAHLSQKFNLGVGLALFITSRPDIFNSIPFPGLLPWASITYDRATLSATYIPGAKDAGNVLFIVGKWRVG